MASLEERLQTLEEANKSLQETNRQQQHEIERLQAVYIVQNLMNKYEYLLHSGKVNEVLELFAMKTPDVRVEMNWGVYEGPESIIRLYPKLHGTMSGHPGCMAMLANTTQVVEVAKDGQTAKCVWMCPGHDTGTYGKGGKPKAHWGYAKRAADFIKEDGEWKIWHYHIYDVFFTPFEQSWVEGFAHPSPDDVPVELRADRPRTTPWVYSPTALMEYVPAAPEPYDTFDEATAY